MTTEGSPEGHRVSVEIGGQEITFETGRLAKQASGSVVVRSGVRAGVVSTPTLFVEGVAHTGIPSSELVARLAGG